MNAPEKVKLTEVVIRPPNFREMVLAIRGTSPYVQSRFFKKAEMMAGQRAGSQARSQRKRTARDFERDYEQAFHRSPDGWAGMPASAIRNAAISACRVAGYKMTHAKLAFFVVADGVDQDYMPIVRIEGEPEMYTSYARNDDGSVDIRARPMFRQWSAKICVRFDADMFSEQDIANLVHRIGLQVGVGEGRPDSKDSAGLGWGLFEIVPTTEEKK